METAKEIISSGLLEIIAIFVTTVLAFIGVQIKNAFVSSKMSETTKNVITSVVKAVQQMYKDYSGDEKLEEAINYATSLLNEKGIDVSDDELRVLIEQSVYEIKNTGILYDAVLTSSEEETVSEPDTIIDANTETFTSTDDVITSDIDVEINEIEVAK